MNDTRADLSDASSLVTAYRVVRERWGIVLLTVLVVVGVVLAKALTSTKQYESTVTLLVQPSQATSVVNQSVNQGVDPQRDQATALLLATSNAVGERVRRALNSPRSVDDLTGSVAAKSEPDANLISVTATDPSPREAARVADAFATQFAAFRLAESRAQLDRSIEELRAQLRATPKALVSQRVRAGQTLAEVFRLRAVTTGGIEVVNRAAVPDAPASPRPKRDAVIALLLGSVAGLGLAFVVDLFDRRLKRLEDFEAVYGLRALASVPARDGKFSDERDRQAELEPFRILSNGIDLITPGRRPRTILVTSAIPQEGKTSIAVGLARAMAFSEVSVVLVEADMRRPTFRRHFDLDAGADGLSSALIDRVPVAELLQSPPGQPNLRLLPSGALPSNAAELLRSARFTRVIHELRDAADVIIIDAPPLLPVADSQVLLGNPEIDACVLVARAYLTTRNEARRATSVIGGRRDTPVGLVVNGIRQLDSGYDYSTEGPAGKTRRAPVPQPSASRTNVE